MKRLVITGVAGFIGSHFARKCLELGHYVYAIDKLTYAADFRLIDEFCQLAEDNRFEWIKEDIKDLDYLPDCDFVVNFAAETHVGNSNIDSQVFIDSNVKGVHNLLELLRNKPENVMERPVLCHISTDEVYGDIVDGKHVEIDMLKPSNPYSATKAAADMLVMAYARTYDIKYFLVRPTNNYGKWQHGEKLIPLSVRRLQEGKKIRLHNNGTPSRNWLYVEDTVDAILTVLEKGELNNIYNVAGNCEQQNYVTAKKIVEAYLGEGITESEFEEKYADFSYSRQGQDIRYALNDDKIKALGWQPQRQFDEELPAIVEFYKQNFRW